MNMYAMAIGQNRLSTLAMHMLRIAHWEPTSTEPPVESGDPIEYGRYRDAQFEPDPDDPDAALIVVTTRCGGGNRTQYQSTLDALADHPWHVRDYDDDYDPTYAMVVYKVPAVFLAAWLKHIDDAGEPGEESVSPEIRELMVAPEPTLRTKFETAIANLKAAT